MPKVGGKSFSYSKAGKKSLKHMQRKQVKK
jgi:hypothetical protein